MGVPKRIAKVANFVEKGGKRKILRGGRGDTKLGKKSGGKAIVQTWEKPMGAHGGEAQFTKRRIENWECKKKKHEGK